MFKVGYTSQIVWEPGGTYVVQCDRGTTTTGQDASNMTCNISKSSIR